MIVAIFFFVLPRIADYRDVWGVVKTLTWKGLLALAVASIVNLLTYRAALAGCAPGSPFSTGVRRHAGIDCVDLRCSRRRGAGHGRVLRDAAWLGVQRPSGGAGGDDNGGLEPARDLRLPAIALGLLTMEGGDNPLLKTMALVGSAVLGGVVVGLVIGFWSAQLAQKVGDLAARLVSWLKRVVRRGPVKWDGEAFVRFREETIGLLRRRWHVITLATLAGHLSVFAVLLVSLRVLDVPASEVTWIEAFAAWSVMRVIGSLPITPGGLGIVELGLTSLLVGFGGGQAEVVAAVLVYRFLTIVPTLLLGMAAAATWRRHQPADT